jgi:dipeptidyl aminopeptidase/acylaminoacyl peptidase
VISISISIRGRRGGRFRGEQTFVWQRPVRARTMWSVSVVLAQVVVAACSLAPPAHASSGGGLIAFRATVDGGHDISVVNEDGSGRRAVIATPSNESQPTWSPDGRRLAFEANDDGDFDIWAMTADGTLDRLVGGGARDGINETQPTWSPNGDSIAYTSNAGGDFEIMVTSLADGSSTDISRDPARDSAPAWSPAGDLIAFGSQRTGSYDVWVARPDGTDPIDLTAGSPGDELQPAWSPSGSSIAYVSNQDAGSHIWRMDANGGHPVQLTGAARDDYSPTWSPDGTEIAFQRRTSAGSQLWIVDADGANARRVPGAGDAARPDWQSVPADAGPIAPASAIEVPADGAVLRPTELTAISGTASDDSAVVRVDVAVRAMNPDGTCDWWMASGFASGPCSTKVWHVATGLAAWTIPVEPLPSTGSRGSYRWYTVFSRATDAVWNVDASEIRGTNRVGFNVAP